MRSTAVLIIVMLLSAAVYAQSDILVGGRTPALSPDGSTIAFSYMGDIWLVPANGGTAHRLTVHESYDANPHFSPDGNWVAFNSDRTGNGDIYIIPVKGGEPTRLTFHSASDEALGWTPDSKNVLFLSRRDTESDVLYQVGIDGTLPRKVTYDLAVNASVSPDGQWLAWERGYTPWWRKHYSGSASRDIWIRPFGGGESRKLTNDLGNDMTPMWSPDGRIIYYVSEREDSTANLYAVPEDGSAAPVRLTPFKGDWVRFASIAANGSKIAFERGGRIWTYDFNSKAAAPVDIVAPSDDKWNNLRRRNMTKHSTEFAFSPDEKQFAFVVHGEIYCAPVKDGRLDDPIRLTETPAREKDLWWSNDGKILYFASDRNGNDDIFAMTSTDPEEERLSKSRKRKTSQLTNDFATENSPQLSPDGKKILYDKGSRVLWTMNVDGSDQKQLMETPQILHKDWSPDSKWIAFSRPTHGHREDIYIVSAGGGEAVNVSRHANDDWQPLWTKDGKRLSFASRTDEGDYFIKYIWLTQEDWDKYNAGGFDKDEEENEEADKKSDEKSKKDKEGKEEAKEVTVKIDWEDIYRRVVTVTHDRGYYWAYDQSPDGKYYAFPSSNYGGVNLWAVNWKGEELRRLTKGNQFPGNIHWKSDNETIAYLSDQGDIYTIANKEGASPSNLGFNVMLSVDWKGEQVEKFNEAWRLLYDGFYDETFHGTNWRAMHDKYLPLLKAARTHSDVSDVIREMIGELSASHLGVYGGSDNDEVKIQTGYMGILYDEKYHGPGIKVTRVVSQTPADRTGSKINAGEFILSIDTVKIAPDMNFYDLLNDKVGKKIDLVVATDAKGRNSREITLEPVNYWMFRGRLYEDWVTANRAMVDSLSGGRVGYLHIAAMGANDYRRFMEDLFGEVWGKDAMVMDIRFNNGGSIHDQILSLLLRRRYGYTEDRSHDIAYNSLDRWDKPIVLVINERCYSDGEIFPMGFKALKLGTVVGVPTYGAVIGTNDVQLIDGTGFRVPGSGWYDMRGEDLENMGIKPDIYVNRPPEESLQGRDSQLQRAVAELMKQLE
jgi:tricorn protease